ncbi:Mov34/MPN/PAD-1 family protein [Polyangium aurulentum]|uniref:Mov34/MPN/PAD-1 family protein n=1 Tax=Polyangium aurulentum TaxID=2567896 RepID=UPI0010ADC885|nr:Mov34/MPN/PAD-1 family protein [Polyangium aurulentum]UQA57162.1 Mov34/MPN/PAD-1 family protein [Polyangium aurulentum]
MGASFDAPWMGGGLRLTRAVVRALEEDARARYTKDEEACGYLVGPADDALLCDEIAPLPNLAARLHQIDPETFFRSARTFFAFEEKKLDQAVRSGRAAGRPVKVIYHSHLDAGAYFSATDAAVMSGGDPPAREGQPGRLGPGPQWPVAFLVTSVRAGANGPVVDEHKLFVWMDKRFVEAPFVIVEG